MGYHAARQSASRSESRLGPIAEAPDLATRQLVFDYLAGEIFQKSNERIQNFLLQTAYVPKMTARSRNGMPSSLSNTQGRSDQEE